MEIMARLLTSFGHTVLGAADCAACRAVASSNDFDLLLCDIGLPDGSGYEVAAQARANGRIKAIALTGFGTEQDVQRSKEAGFDAHMVKPVDFRVLLKLLASLPAATEAQARSAGS